MLYNRMINVFKAHYASKSSIFSSFIFYFGQIILLYSELISSQEILKPTAPSYAPFRVECPSGRRLLRLAGSALHKNQTLSEGEQSFLQGRKSVLEPLWREFFTHGPGSKTGYQHTALMDDNQHEWPTLGLAHSGGGQRAALYGAGVLHAFDARTTSSPVRGVLQLATYIAGLSGGSWLVTSLAANDYPPIPQLVEGWDLSQNIVFPGGLNPIADVKFLKHLHDATHLKDNAGFRVSLTDLWGLAIGRHFLPRPPQNSHKKEWADGAGLLFSALKEMPSFKNFQVPFPIVVSNHNPLTTSRLNPAKLAVVGPTTVPLSMPVYECSPIEFGSHDCSLNAFIPTEFLGTALNAGQPVASSNKNASPGQNCVKGFDQATFVIGSSASMLNTILTGALTGLSKRYFQLLRTLAGKISNSDKFEKATTASYPNPFKGVHGELPFDGAKSDTLEIVDGGENGENLPLTPLLVPTRQVDVIVASDATDDTDSSYIYGENWPNGVSLINTFLRVHRVLPKGEADFPLVPVDPKVWTNKGLGTRPTFFGCDAPAQSGNGGYPLIIYLPNSPLAQKGFATNISTLKLQCSKKDTQAFIESTMQATAQPVFRPNQTDDDWPTCLSCALIERSRNRMNVSRSSACQICFKRYCYSGSS
ncbi:hypothetical protein O181_037258 [Austropuccinia psidii MF-1]|uniref:Lysophospholipase n=1 Tax=Austropuccinia psidii MF-1 TaxID=1389203 RepID=A0A9Q3H9X7_9BASI|nr:hypothetical protein [Austropuccinia psidii MF-1]